MSAKLQLALVVVSFFLAAALANPSPITPFLKRSQDIKYIRQAHKVPGTDGKTAQKEARRESKASNLESKFAKFETLEEFKNFWDALDVLHKVYKRSAGHGSFWGYPGFLGIRPAVHGHY